MFFYNVRSGLRLFLYCFAVLGRVTGSQGYENTPELRVTQIGLCFEMIMFSNNIHLKCVGVCF